MHFSFDPTVLGGVQLGALQPLIFPSRGGYCMLTLYKNMASDVSEQDPSLPGWNVSWGRAVFFMGHFHWRDTKPRTPRFPDRTRLFHICEEAPSVLPPECFPSTDWHANLQCGEENVASQHFTLLPPPPPADRHPPSPPLYWHSSTVPVCDITDLSPKHAKTKKKRGERRMYSICVTLPLPPSFTSFQLGGGWWVRRRRRKIWQLVSVSVCGFHLQLMLPTVRHPEPFYHPCVERKGCSSGLLLCHPVIEETVTVSRWRAALLPAAAGLAWPQPSQLAAWRSVAWEHPASPSRLQRRASLKHSDQNTHRHTTIRTCKREYSARSFHIGLIETSHTHSEGGFSQRSVCGCLCSSGGERIVACTE